MTSHTPQKAVNKAKQAKDMIAAAMQAEMIKQQMPINPEVRSGEVADLQGPTTNPMHMYGQMPPNVYDFDNRLGGYVGSQPVFNPEA